MKGGLPASLAVPVLFHTLPQQIQIHSTFISSHCLYLSSAASAHHQQRRQSNTQRMLAAIAAIAAGALALSWVESSFRSPSQPQQHNSAPPPKLLQKPQRPKPPGPPQTLFSAALWRQARKLKH